MTTPLLLFVIAAFALQTVPAAGQFNNGSIPVTYKAKVIESSNGTCPTAEEREAVLNEIRFEVRKFLITHTCGGTDGWTRIAYLNMSDNSQHCPGNLTEVTYEGIRLCARDSRSNDTNFVCTSATFPTNNTLYSAVCGRVVGYGYGATVAFYAYDYYGAVDTIDEYYVDGVTLTHGPVGAREHIWTFVSGQEENPSNYSKYVCPCAPNADPSIAVPPFIGEDYFCESGTYIFRGSTIFHNDPLWDGDGCSEGNSCCTFNNPPFFTRQLPASTSDDIELRDCGLYYGPNSDTLIQFIELYVK